MQNYLESLGFYNDYARGVMRTTGYQTTSSTDQLINSKEGQAALVEKNYGGQYLNTILAAHLFEVDPSLSYLLENTNNAVRKDVRLPFGVCFFDVRLGLEDRQYYGLMMYEAYLHPTKQLNGMRTLEIPYTPEAAAKMEAEGRERKIFIQTVFKRGSAPERYEMKLNLHDDYKHYPHITMNDTGATISTNEEFEDEAGFLRRLAMNLLDFIHDPEVKLIRLQRSEKNLKRHAERGDASTEHMPSLYTRITLTGELRQYVQAAKALRNKPGQYSHKFYVRGHFRHLRSERYKEARGKTLWIPPHIKGEGILVRKSYGVEAPPTEVA